MRLTSSTLLLSLLSTAYVRAAFVGGAAADAAGAAGGSRAGSVAAAPARIGETPPDTAPDSIKPHDPDNGIDENPEDPPPRIGTGGDGSSSNPPSREDGYPDYDKLGDALSMVIDAISKLADAASPSSASAASISDSSFKSQYTTPSAAKACYSAYSAFSVCSAATSGFSSAPATNKVGCLCTPTATGSTSPFASNATLTTSTSSSASSSSPPNPLDAYLSSCSSYALSISEATITAAPGDLNASLASQFRSAASTLGAQTDACTQTSTGPVRLGTGDPVATETADGGIAGPSRGGADALRNGMGIEGWIAVVVVGGAIGVWGFL